MKGQGRWSIRSLCSLGGAITSPLGSVDVLNDCQQVLGRKFPTLPEASILSHQGEIYFSVVWVVCNLQKVQWNLPTVDVLEFPRFICTLRGYTGVI